MNALLATAEAFVIDRVLNTDTPSRSKSKAWQVFLALSGFMLVLGLGFMVFGVYLWLDMHRSPDEAIFLTGALIVFLALVFAMGAYVMVQYKLERLRKIRDEIMDTVQQALEVVDGELSEPVRENPKTAMLIASLAGYVAGERFL